MTDAPPPSEPYRHRQVAESFGRDADRYDRARPRYPEAMVERIVAALPGLDVLDVGCGTGIEARQFQAAGCRVLGLEPDERMAEFARRSGVEVEVSTFEAWEGAGRVFDAVVAGQAWHWVDPVAGAARAAEVLRRNGVLAPFWQVYEPPRAVTEAFVSACRRLIPHAPFDREAMKDPVGACQVLVATTVDGMRKAGGFGAPEQWRFDWEQRCTREQWLDELRTLGTLSQLGPGGLAQLLAEVGDAVDGIGGSFTMRYTALVVSAVRTRR